MAKEEKNKKILGIGTEHHNALLNEQNKQVQEGYKKPTLSDLAEKAIAAMYGVAKS